MPLPRKPRPKRRLGGSRSARRRVHEKAWIQAKLVERFARVAEIIEHNRQRDIANGDFPNAQEKTPGLAAEGFSSCFQEKTPSG